MSDIQQTKIVTPPCPVCTSATALKQTHKHDHERVLLIFKCKSCAVEYPVLTDKSAR